MDNPLIPKIRDAFERWAVEGCVLTLDRDFNDTDRYESLSTRYAWYAYRDQTLKAVEALAKAYKASMPVDTKYFTMEGARELAIQALLTD